MAETILADSVMMKLSDGVHLLASFERLRIVNNQEDVSVVLTKQAPQHIQGNGLHNLRIAPAASPQKLAMIRPVRGASQGFGEAFYGVPMTDGDRQNRGTS